MRLAVLNIEIVIPISGMCNGVFSDITSFGINKNLKIPDEGYFSSRSQVHFRGTQSLAFLIKLCWGIITLLRVSFTLSHSL